MCKTTYDEVKSDYHDQANKINSQVSQYQDAFAKYEKEYNDYLAKIQNTDSVDSKVIWQNLFLNFGQGSKLSVQWNTKPLETHQNQTNGDDNYSYDFAKALEYSAVFNGSQSGVVGTATWEIPSGAYYKNLDGSKVRIAKIVSVLKNVVANGSNNNHVLVGFFNNPTLHAFSSFASSVDETFYFYDETGNLINFKDGTAWLGIASLNHWWGDGTQNSHDVNETVKAVSGAKLYTPNGSISLSDDETTTQEQVPATNLGGGTFGVGTKDFSGFAVAKISNGATLRWAKNGFNNHGTFHWDDTRKTYVASDNETVFTDTTNNINSWYQWAMSTDLYGMAKTIKTPAKPTVSYNYSTVIACLRLHR